MIENTILRSEERAVFALRSLYRKYGYLPFKMSKFEEYEFYMQNKDFLVSDRIITFNDTNGRLLALKPDVTLSIVKNGEDIQGFKQKVCYNENVYRVSENTNQFKEIMQTGIECIGSIDLYDIYEMVLLAAKSLALISDDFVLEISHLGLLASVLDSVCGNQAFRQNAMKYIAEKNMHDLSRLCDENAISAKYKEVLLGFVSNYGERGKVLQELKKKKWGEYLPQDAVNELEKLSEMLDTLPFSSKIRFDFSSVNNLNYYNGIVFKGYLSGISQSVLTGGQYDKLLRKMNRKSGAIGFALYLDLLEGLPGDFAEYDVDILLLYDENTDKTFLADRVADIINAGNTVSVQTSVSDKIRFREIEDVRGGGQKC